MAEDARHEVTLDTLHQDLGELRQELKQDLGEFKGLVASGLKAFPPQWPTEVLRVLRRETA